MIARIRTALRHDEGASAVEYGLLIAGIAALIVAIVFLLGGTIKNAFSRTNSCITNSTAGQTC
jgi:pilus assembly protein Flp/PilA